MTEWFKYWWRRLWRGMCDHDWDLENPDDWEIYGRVIVAKDLCTKCGAQRTLTIHHGSITYSKTIWPDE